MTGFELRQARASGQWTQKKAAERLGVTQAYLSMLERAERPVSDALARRAVDLFEVPATLLPLPEYAPGGFDEKRFKQALGMLGYSGFAYLSGDTKFNPAAVLMHGLDTDDLDARVAEALPWLPATFPLMDWEWLTRYSKLNDRQNRLAFVVSVASEVAARRGDIETAKLLSVQVQRLERSRLATEDTFCKDSMTRAERAWLRQHRSEAARHWSLLTDLSAEQVTHA
jgi:transcriptional regulator with XRE-family HTH domain